MCNLQQWCRKDRHLHYHLLPGGANQGGTGCRHIPVCERNQATESRHGSRGGKLYWAKNLGYLAVLCLILCKKQTNTFGPYVVANVEPPDLDQPAMYSKFYDDCPPPPPHSVLYLEYITTANTEIRGYIIFSLLPFFSLTSGFAIKCWRTIWTLWTTMQISRTCNP